MTTRRCRQGGRGEETSLVTPGRGKEWQRSQIEGKGGGDDDAKEEGWRRRWHQKGGRRRQDGDGREGERVGLGQHMYRWEGVVGWAVVGRPLVGCC